MSAIDRLLANYTRQVRLPWSPNAAGKQRVWFAVYPPSEERRVRARMPQFEEVTLGAGHDWIPVDLTALLPEFLSTHKYREEIFKKPQHLKAGTQLEVRAATMVDAACAHSDANSVVVITGLASLFDFMRVSSLIDRVEDSVRGRLLVMFPGEFQGTLYRFMDARDGFNYMATPITSTESFLTS
ncbi:BREX protein BrxB domain-containing protein [Haloferula sp. BvORR071]|uniref:BREX protein BrxB domain-containing protein n=1 Tax=Haloferula sp. BvORR071 TaxID=1396141 RepID=UPI000558E9AD|nr:BREX protein BrxB domain-containing protein [Haloferula sp. BvORR071]